MAASVSAASCWVWTGALALEAGIGAIGGLQWWRARRRRGTCMLPPPSPLSEPLLAQPHTSEPAESNDGPYMIKGVRGLWWRQCLLLAQAALQLTLLVYALATGGEGEIPSSSSPTSTSWAATRHGLAALVWASLAGIEELGHRTSAHGRLPWPLLLAHLLAAAAALLPATQALTNDSSITLQSLFRFADAWSGVAALVVLSSALAAATCLPAPVWHRPNRPPTPEERAGLLSYTVFNWFSPVISKGVKQTSLDPEADLPPLGEGDRAEEVWGVFVPLVARMGLGVKQSQLQGQEQGDVTAPLLPKPHKKHWKGTRITRLLFQLGRMDVVVQAFWQAIGSLAVFIAPLALREIVGFVSHYGEQESKRIPTRVLVCTALLFLGPAIQAVADAMNFFCGRRLILRYRAALLGLIFRKALRIDMSAGSSSSIGELTNLCSVDANSVEAVGYGHFLWSTLLQIFVCVYLIFHVLGPSALAGLAFMIVSLPITAWASARIQRDQTRMMKKKDARMSIVSEVLQGIRIIKLFAWERDFLQRIDQARALELRDLRRFIYTRSIIIITWDATPTLVALSTFLVHTLAMKKPLTAAAGFAALSLFDLLRFPLVVLPDMINYVSKALVSFGRIEAFLEREEVESGSVFSSTETQHDGAPATPALVIRNGTFRWGGSGEGPEGNGTTVPPTLQGINLTIPASSLTCIYGGTGGGKTSLLMAMLGEIRRLPGANTTVHRAAGSRVAYVGQKAWIRNATLRENVVFGLPFDEAKYQRTIEACALERDLTLLEAGDMTEIGERGINLSGGQQQRVNLARAVYRALMGEADILLIDDALSAVDAHVGEHIFRDCISDSGALAGTTRVLVTHQVALTLPQADQVVIMGKDGTILEQGPRAMLQDRAADILVRYGVVASSDDGEQEETAKEEEGKEDGASSPSSSDKSKPSEQQNGSSNGSTKGEKETKPDGDSDRGGRLVEEEARAKGALTLATYRAYVRAMGGLAVALLLLVEYGGVELLRYLQTRSLGGWVDRLVADAGNGAKGSGPFILISIAGTVVILLRALTQCWASLRASWAVHRAMAARVMRAPCAWFERTPVGRVLNRFSSDIETLDKNLMDSLGSFLECALNAFSVVAVIAAHAPLLLLGLLPLLALAAWVARAYLACSRELKRLEAVSRSPIYSHFSETIGGVSVVRAYGVQDQFVAESQQRVDKYSRVDFFLWTANRWLAIRLQLLGAVVTGLVGMYILVTLPSGRLSGSTAGLTLLYAMQFSSALNWLIRNQAEAEMNMNSLERAEEYCHVEQEAAEVNDAYRPPSEAWPDKGDVRVAHLTLRYPSAAIPVIRDLSFTIPPGTRVGVVGRTGAGKSSLLSALYRLVEPEPTTPPCALVIDGVDALKLGLRDLRSRLAIVPQDPTLFRGTVRSNMDPFQEYDDMALHDALRRAHLWDALARKQRQQHQPHDPEGPKGEKGKEVGGASTLALPRKAWRRLRSAVSLPSLAGAAAAAVAVAAEEGEEEATIRLTGASASSSLSGEDEGESAAVSVVPASVLAMPITENGDNLSVGERQLLCMARALLRKRAVLIMDEATANVDPETDSLIQETLREAFVGCTVITVAHRLATVVYYDKVLVMDRGEIKEYDAPLRLLEGGKDGIFYNMCEKTGDLPRLIAMARESSARAGNGHGKGVDVDGQ